MSRLAKLFLALLLGAVLIPAAASAETPRRARPRNLPYTPVVTPNGSTLDWVMKDGVKEFRLIVEPCKHEVAPGMVINAWCYNGQTPGPTIEAVEGDRVRILVTNKLPEPTAVHWHGLLLPSGMDGVAGLSQPAIPPGETWVYEFPLKQHGTQMYHSHGDEMVQIGLGAMGFFIIHPRERRQRIDRDYALFVAEWFVPPGAATPDVSVMTDFNIFTFNSRAFPGTETLVAQAGERVRIRLANVDQESHPIHLHGHTVKVVATDGGDIPPSAQWPETTVVVFPGQTRDFEFVATSGDWPLHCHRRHHPMNAMGHDLPNLIGVNQDGAEQAIRKQLPDYMAMGETGMHEMAGMGMQGPANTLPMMGGDGPFGSIAMGGMFTLLKVRDRLRPGEDPGWFPNPPGTVAYRLVEPAPGKAPGPGAAPPTTAPAAVVYTCPMHPEVRRDSPGSCPKCGMRLVPEKVKPAPTNPPSGHEQHR